MQMMSLLGVQFFITSFIGPEVAARFLLSKITTAVPHVNSCYLGPMATLVSISTIPITYPYPYISII